MKHLIATLVLLVTVFSPLSMGHALEVVEKKAAPPNGGEVRLPLTHYTTLINQLSHQVRPAPADYAIGRSEISVRIDDREEQAVASVAVTLMIETFEDEWTLVPILPSGAALKQATIDGRPVQLVQGPDGLSWSTDKAGAVTMQLLYGVDARRSESGYVLPIPTPRAAATNFVLDFPGTGIDLAVVPSSDLQTIEAEGRTRYSASIPATSSILVSWRSAGGLPYAISRAAYEGALIDDALVWTGRFQIEIFGGEMITLPLMPSDVTLSDIRVNGEVATVLEEEGRFATPLQGRGTHEVTVSFQVPVTANRGAPSARLAIPRVPVSRFDLSLPGRKEVTVNPGANVTLSERGEETLATAFIPMSESVTFSWTNAVPIDLRTELRANASLYHAIHAEEGVLHARAMVLYEITRGETSILELEIPIDAQVNRILAPSGGLTDWTEAMSDREGHKRIKVFLDRAVSGEFLLDVSYESLLSANADEGDPIAVPFIHASEVHRQRGMAALLSSPELTLQPVAESGLTRVGENQLPAFLRNQIALTVAHTYKYIDPAPRLTARTVVPERKQGRFDAQVDTLVSIGEVTMKGSATIGVEVKSGTIDALDIRLPEGINVLEVSGPSLRSHEESESADGRVIHLEFTREMDGQFRIEVNYEKIMESDTPETMVPTVTVAAAEVEHGRIAVEALTAVEVLATATDHLSTLDFNELPQQLVLKTTNPILLAYRYVHAIPPFRLALKITRHEQIDVQVAAVEQASYTSLFTRDGLAVTTARLIVRNSRQQFLRLQLPAGSQVWSVFVDGKPEKPAYAADAGEGTEAAVLIKMINAAEGFPVDIVYATPAPAVKSIGSVAAHLPRPDMVVTHTRWDVFLPVGPRYGTPDSTMDLVIAGAWANPRVAGNEALRRAADAYQSQMGQPLRLSVPAQGVHFAFEKLYANQSRDEAEFSVRYLSGEANQISLLASGVGALVVWLGIAAIANRRVALPRRAIGAVLLVGVGILIVTIGYLGTSPVAASVVALVVPLLWAFWWLLSWLRAWRGRTATNV